MQTGAENSKNMPVGSTLAMIEQGQQVMSTVHRQNHGALAKELRIRFDLCKEYAPDEGYPYDVDHEQNRMIYTEDFNGGFDIVPVSDPNISSNVQELARYQELYKAMMENPDQIDRREVLKAGMKILKIPDAENYLPDQPEPQVYTPQAEVQALLTMKPIRVVPEQDHMSHVQHLAAFAQNPGFGGNPQVMGVIGPNLSAVIGQHLAYLWMQHNRTMGVPAEAMDFESGKMMGQPQVPIEQLVQAMGQLAPNLMQAPGLPGAPQEQQDPKIAAEMAKMQIEADGKREDIMAKREEREAKQIDRQLEREHKVEMAELDAKIKLQEAQIKQMIEEMKAMTQWQSEQRKAQLDNQKQYREAAMDQQQMAREDDLHRQEVAQRQQQSEQEAAIREHEAHQQTQLDQMRARQKPGNQIPGEDNG